MLPYLAIGAGIALFAWLSSSENDARQEYEQKRQSLQSEKEAREKQLKNLNKELKLDQRYYEYVALHHASVHASEQAYALYDKQKSLIALMNTKIHEFVSRIDMLKKLRKENMGQQKQYYHDEMQVIYKYLSEAKVEKQKLYEQKSQMLENVRAINAQTHQLKLYIGKHCGEKGKKWLEQREIHRPILS